MIGFENAIMAQTVPRAVSMSAAWCADPPTYDQQQQQQQQQQHQQQQQQQNNNNMQHYGASAAATAADPSDLDNFDLSLLLPQPAAAEPTSSADGTVPAGLQQQDDDHQILSQLTGGGSYNNNNNNNGPNCYAGADTLDTLDLTQLLSLYDDYCTAEAAGNFQDVLLKSSATAAATAATALPATAIKEEVDDFQPSPSASPSAFISSSSSPRPSACGVSEVTYNVNCTWFVKDEPSEPTSADLTTTAEGAGKRRSSSVLLRSLLESSAVVKDEPNDCCAATTTTDDDGVETKPDLGSADGRKASSHRLLVEMLRGPKEERLTTEDDPTTSAVVVGSTSPANAVAELAELLLYSACSSTDQGVPTADRQQFDDDKTTAAVHKSSVLQRASHRKWTSSPEQQQWAANMVGQQHQWDHSNSPSLDMTVPSLSPQQNGALGEVDLCAGQALFDDTAALVDGLLFGDGACRDFKSEPSNPASPQDEHREDEVRIRAQMDMWKSLLLQQEQQDDDHRQKRNSSTDISNGQQPPMKRQRIDHEQDTILSTTSLSPLGSFSPASSTSSGGLPLPMLDVNDNIMSIPISVDCGDRDEEDGEYYAGTAATSPSSSARSPGSCSAASSGTAGSSGQQQQQQQQHHHHHIHLWQFLKELLQQHDDHGLPAVAEDGGKPTGTATIIRWLDRPKGVFKIEDSVAVAKLWGRRKNRPAMNYDKLSRSIRQYYKKGIMKKTERSQRLVYQFCHPYSGGSPSTAAASPGATADV
ncbi:myb-like protein Q [Adelges cooleyi]|uniref:myb-like protein Q n=1 Tax=Adelges cooleyi TaxID=133065 RepID=UPI0021807D23|nr:myb-like protein Q [Adelges cooleyi]